MKGCLVPDYLLADLGLLAQEKVEYGLAGQAGDVLLGLDVAGPPCTFQPGAQIFAFR